MDGSPGAEPQVARQLAELRLAHLLAEYHGLVQRNLRRLGVEPSATADAAQDVFIVVARKLDLIHPGCERGFVLGVAAGVAANYRRARATRAELHDERLLDTATDPAPDADVVIDDGRRRELLGHLLDCMPFELRRVLISFELEGLSMAQIAEHCCTPVGTVASRLQRARRYLKRAVLRRKASGLFS